MLEREMYPIFARWLYDNSDMFMHEPLIPATCCFDFIALKDKHVVVYELKLANAKEVILQANSAILWCDHSYAVLPKNKIHLGIKHKDRMAKYVGLMSLDMTTGIVETVIEPEIKRSHIGATSLRQGMIDWMLKRTIDMHQDVLSLFKKQKFQIMGDKK